MIHIFLNTDVYTIPSQTDKGKKHLCWYSTVLCEPLLMLCITMSDAIGCPLEFIVFPLLTFAAACMGVNLCSCGHQWDVERTSHHLVHWSLKGQKKTAAFRLLKKPFEETEHMEAEKWRRQQNNLQPQAPTTHFSFEELHHVMKRNGPQILELFDEMSTMYSQLDLYKQSGSVMDRKTLITLNGGSSWSRNYRNYTQHQ